MDAVCKATVRRNASIVCFISLAACATPDDGLLIHNPELAQQQASDGVGPFPLLHWEMRANEIKRIYPDFHDAFEPSVRVRELTPVRILQTDRFPAGQCAYRVTLRYVRSNRKGRPLIYEGLHDIELRLIEGDLAACREAITAELLNRYGRHPEAHKGDPNPPKNVSTSDYMQWWGPITAISLTTTFIGDERPVLDVSYRDAAYDENYRVPEY